MVSPQSSAQPPRSTPKGGLRAVVIGGGVAGLAACSAIAPHVASITLIEQEPMPTEPMIRRHTPQAPHVHALLDSGRQALEQLMPGLGAALQNAGSLPLRVRSQWRSHDGHEWCAPEDTGPVVLSQSRPLLEHVLRCRVLALPHLLVQTARVRGLMLATGEGTRAPRLIGVSLDDSDGQRRQLDADIVVDASGRAGDSLKWFETAGLELPPEMTRHPDIRYTSAFFARPAQTRATPPSAWLRPAQAPATQGLVMAPIEGDRWVVTLIGRFGASMPRDEDGFRQRALAIAGPELADSLASARMLSQLRGFAIKSVRFRRFDRKASALPLGYFPIGDTIATFNPLYGQGMSVAALQAVALQQALSDHTAPAVQQRSYLTAAHRPADWAWKIGGAVDRAYAQMRQQEDADCDHFAERLRLAFSASVLRPELRGQIDRVLHLLDAPEKLDALCTEPVQRGPCPSSLKRNTKMKLLTTAPPSVQFAPGTYLEAVGTLAQWNEAAGVEGMLIYTDNSLMDPWTVAQAVMERTRRFKPLVAVQPLYMSPLAAARKVSSLAFLYGRKMALNMVAGGFVKDLEQLGDATEHDARYDRLVEYTQIMQALLRGETVTFSGTYYQVANLCLSPALPPELMPDLFLSGASDACAAAAATLEATRLSYTKPPQDLEPQAPLPGAGQIGLRFGVIARETADEAWREARSRFPEDRRGQLAHKMARGATDSIWHQEISQKAEDLHEARDGAYWLFPLRNYKTFCPYLVGSYGEVAAYVGRYRALGYTALILDVPSSEEELQHSLRAVKLGGAEVLHSASLTHS